MDMFKEYLRMCNEINNCNKCPIYIESSTVQCNGWMADNYDEAVSLIRKWAEEHPKKTYEQDFLEKFPNARKYEDGELEACVRTMYGVKCPHISSQMSCKDCWNRPMEE